MKARLLAFATALVALVATALPAAAEGVTVTPAAVPDVFPATFAGQGFEPGATVSVLLVAPDGNRLTILRDGIPQVLIVQPDGSWALTLLPARDMPGTPLGTWSAEFCYEQTTNCWSGTFEILPRPVAEALFIEPAVGGPDALFTFAGGGYIVGARVAFVFFDPLGRPLQLTINGQPAVVVADANGVAVVQIQPVTGFPEVVVGGWTAVSCYEGTQVCAATRFTITG